MKTIYFILLIILVSGCGSINPKYSTNISVEEGSDVEMNGNSDSIEKPNHINLVFNPLMMEDIKSNTEITTKWELIKSIPFGEIEGNEVELEIYKSNSKEDNLRSELNGILKTQEVQLVISDLADSFIEKKELDCSQFCLFQRIFAEQEQYELLGSVELYSNGPGNRLYIVYDLINDKFKSFNAWGEPYFIDLDDDGSDEFIIEFQGLHMSLPDITIIKAYNGKLGFSESVFSSIQRNPGDFATLNINNNPPTIMISNVQSDLEKIHNYIYNQGVLERTESKLK
ncbi:hypothetical protein JJQ72_01345 [Paenibacillus sp. F411]|uniref:hypothetical protein n=1 Tax=Paenibacillus sp. F411 TaxID=2820239 RepID=UPI001AAFD917|nr:hypothetical protein [Paenibacillus sp. F411]MBO2942629.1 hypothetical protein [Paenibacillus sp. F411]